MMFSAYVPRGSPRCNGRTSTCCAFRAGPVSGGDPEGRMGLGWRSIRSTYEPNLPIGDPERHIECPVGTVYSEPLAVDGPRAANSKSPTPSAAIRPDQCAEPIWKHISIRPACVQSGNPSQSTSHALHDRCALAVARAISSERNCTHSVARRPCPATRAAAAEGSIAHPKHERESQLNPPCWLSRSQAAVTCRPIPSGLQPSQEGRTRTVPPNLPRRP